MRGDFSRFGDGDFLRRALKIHEELGRKEGMANALGNLGALTLEQDRLDEAEEYLRRALTLYTEIGAVGEGPAVCETQMGLVHLARGDKPQACAAWTPARDIYRRIGNEAQAARVGQIMEDSGCPTD